MGLSNGYKAFSICLGLSQLFYVKVSRHFMVFPKISCCLSLMHDLNKNSNGLLFYERQIPYLIEYINIIFWPLRCSRSVVRTYKSCPFKVRIRLCSI